MIEYQSEPIEDHEHLEHSGDATGHVRVGSSIVPERLQLAVRSRAARLVSAMVVGAAVLTAVLVARPHHSAPAALPPVDPAATGRVSALDDVSVLTAPGQFTTSVRQSSGAHPCPAVAAGHEPSTTVAAIVAHAVADTHVIGVTQTVDQFHGLCALTVALVDAQHARFTVSVTAPTTGVATTAAVRPVARPERLDGLIEYAVIGWRTGWWLLVSVVGYPGEVANPLQLSAVANSQDLLW